MGKNSYFTKSELELFESHEPIFTPDQMKIINRVTPKSQIETKSENGIKYKSVKAPYAKAILMLVTGGNYTFEIKHQAFIEQVKEVKTTGRLTIFTKSGKAIFREQNGKGRADNCNANLYKSSSTDCLKKCMSEFGFFWDIYGQEIKQPEKTTTEDYTEKKKLERLEHFLKESKTSDDIEHNYNTFLQTEKETEASKTLLKKYMEIVLNK